MGIIFCNFPRSSSLTLSLLMTPLHFPSSLSLRPISSSSHPKPLQPHPQNLPARDRVIEFGKHKGRMLGTLPSKYLTWVSKNLRARDFRHWAELADQVLRDPVYRDRLEWESAERILNGDAPANSSLSDSPVSGLLEISEKFGWDNDDKDGWGRIDFQLLGTSKGGRIPRVRTGLSDRDFEIGEKGFSGREWRSRNERKGGILIGDLGVEERMEVGNGERVPRVRTRFNNRDFQIGEKGFSRREWRSRNERKDGILGGDFGASEKKVGVLRDGERFEIGEEVSLRVNREERRERRRIKRGEQLEMVRREVGVEETSDVGYVKRRGGKSGKLVNHFPGRGALLDKISRERG